MHLFLLYDYLYMQDMHVWCLLWAPEGIRTHESGTGDDWALMGAGDWTKVPCESNKCISSLSQPWEIIPDCCLVITNFSKSFFSAKIRLANCEDSGWICKTVENWEKEQGNGRWEPRAVPSAQACSAWCPTAFTRRTEHGYHPVLEDTGNLYLSP